MKAYVPSSEEMRSFFFYIRQPCIVFTTVYAYRFIPERLLFLGPDLAAAHFLVHRDAAVKFVGENVWIKKDKKGRYDLPGRRVPDLFIEAIDASDTELMFEGLLFEVI